MDAEFTPGFLDTPSLMTPNIGVTPLLYKPPENDTQTSDGHTHVSSGSNPSSINTAPTSDESPSISTAEIKVYKIENDLKQSLNQPRKPTESPFQKMAEAGVLTFEKNLPLPPTADDGLPVDIPSTADVMNDIESFVKCPVGKDSAEREVNLGESNRFDSSPTHSMGVIVSPKKKLLIRSQSHTEPASPSTLASNHLSQPRRTSRDEENPIEDDIPQFQPTLILTGELNPPAEATYAVQSRAHHNGLPPTMAKQQPVVLNPNKRTFTQAMNVTALPKAAPSLSSQPVVINEVTSSDQLLGVKRAKITPAVVRTSFPSPSHDNSNSANNSSGSDDQRKKQIRDSNREAARRCRERRRNYIEQLEGNLEQCKAQIKQLTDSLALAERENTQLRAIITESKLFHGGVRLPSNESMAEFSSMLVNANGVDLNSETTDGNSIQRSYIARNTH